MAVTQVYQREIVEDQVVDRIIANVVDGDWGKLSLG